MSTTRKKIRQIVIVLFALFLACAVSVPFSVPAIVRTAWFKGKVALTLGDVLGRPVTIGGPIELVLSLNPQLAVTDVSFESPPGFGERDMLAVGTLRISIPLIDNLQRRYRFHSIALENVSVLAATNKEGISNWSFSGQDREQDSDDRGSIPILPLIEKLTMKNTTVVVKNRDEERTILFENIEAEDIGLENNGTLSSRMKLDGIPIVLKGGAEALKKFFAGEDLHFDVELAQGRQTFAATGALRRDGKYDLTVNAAGDDFTALAPLLRVNLPHFGAFRLNGRLVRIPGPDERIELSEAKAFLAGREITGDVTIEPRRKKGIGLRGDLESGTHRIRLDLTFLSGVEISGTIDGSGGDLSELSPLVFVALPAWKDYEARGKLTYSERDGKKLVLDDASVRVGRNNLEGSTSIGFSPLVVRADLQSKYFDTDLLRTFSPGEGEGTASAKKSEGDPSVPFELFDNIELDVALSAEAFRGFLGLELGDLHSRIRIDHGALAAPNFSAKAFGGVVTGSLEAERKSIALTVKGEHLAANPLFIIAGATPIVDGDFDFSAELRGAGERRSEILKSLSGVAQLSSGNAVVKTGSMQAVTSGLTDILSPLFGDKKRSKADCVVINYEIEKGIATSKEQVISVDDIFFFGKGTIDFSRLEVDYTFNTQSSRPALASLIPPFRASGKLPALRFTPTISGSVAALIDSTQGVADTALGVLTSAANVFLSVEEKNLSGVDVCHEAYKAEQQLLSSRVGSALESIGKR